MNNEVMISDKDAVRAGLAALRAPFEERLIGKLPYQQKPEANNVRPMR